MIRGYLLSGFIKRNSLAPLFILICIGGFLWGLEDSLDARVKKTSKVAVTYGRGGGRFGDNLISYLHAKWISYHYKIPLLYKTFKYSDQLTLHEKEKKLTSQLFKSFSHVITPSLKRLVDYTERNPSTLYVIPYFPEIFRIPENKKDSYHFNVDWDDPGFVNEIRKMLTPISIRAKLVLPKDRISVAVHVRKGGGFDTPDKWKKRPLKLPPDSYYIEQIERMSTILGGEPLYVYIFTDDESPATIVEHFEKYFENTEVQFDCRREGNHHNANVVQDFVEMGQFDCLIRPNSHYSIVISKIAPFKVVISPSHFAWLDENIGYVDEVEVYITQEIEGKRVKEVVIYATPFEMMNSYTR